MKILHYSTGFDTDKGGGITRYTTDLMVVQSKNHEVILLYPGEFSAINKKTKIRKSPNKYGIINYRIVNPLPIPFLNGIRVEDYERENDDYSVWDLFFKELNLDVFHIHTFVGLSSNGVIAAKNNGIRIIYTTHDFFGICAKQTLFYRDQPCKTVNSCLNCPACNATALSYKKMFFLHSRLYKSLRRTKLMLFVKNKFKSSYGTDKEYDAVNTVDDFLQLKSKYEKLFKMVDLFHFNSSITESNFKKYLSNVNGKNIPITLNNIKNNRKKIGVLNPIKFTYLGPPQAYKGFDFLIDVLDKVYEDNKNFVLNIFFKAGTKLDKPYYTFISEGYTPDDLEKIFINTHILLVPSQCMETFGLVVREAMSFGVPVLVTNNVGSKDVIENNVTGIIRDNDEWLDCLLHIVKKPDSLLELNNNILERDFYDMQKHESEINKLYLTLCSETIQS